MASRTEIYRSNNLGKTKGDILGLYESNWQVGVYGYLLCGARFLKTMPGLIYQNSPPAYVSDFKEGVQLCIQVMKLMEKHFKSGYGFKWTLQSRKFLESRHAKYIISDFNEITDGDKSSNEDILKECIAVSLEFKKIINYKKGFINKNEISDEEKSSMIIDYINKKQKKTTMLDDWNIVEGGVFSDHLYFDFSNAVL